MTLLPTPDALATIPLFPIEGAILLPNGDLPLNIFEPRYIAMVRAALAGDRLIGMIQPCPCPEKMNEGSRPFYQVGCVGRISSFEETRDGRFLITLHGISRFSLLSHKMNEQNYRVAEVSLENFTNDFSEPAPLPECMTRGCLVEKFQEYLGRHELYVDWDMAEDVPDHRFYTLLAMICPFSPAEKQALLEAPDFEQRCRMMKCMMDIACANDPLSPQDLPC